MVKYQGCFLLFWSFLSFGMQDAETITDLVVVPRRASFPTSSAPSINSDNDIKIWVREQLDSQLKAIQIKLDTQTKDIESHKQDTSDANTKTRLALVATVVTTVCGVATTLVTYFVTRNNTVSG